MSINKSEEFVYFQNKTRHYDNIKKIKPKVNDHLQQRYLRTLDLGTTESKRITPLMKQYQMKMENMHLTNRVIGILQSPRREVEIQGHYSRYNDFDRKFRKRNPYQDEEKRQIKISNNALNERLINAKPKVGTLTQWNQYYQNTTHYRRNLSRYLNNQKSKGQLHISVDKFIPEHYRSFIDNDELDNKGSITVSKLKMLQLPQLSRRDYSQPPFKFRINFKSNSSLANDD